MVKATYYKTSQDWLEQSAELLRACPTSTRITTKYSIKKPKTKLSSSSSTAADSTKRAFLTLKTFDPSSGATLKFKTTKAAEVSRLISALGMLGRDMAGLPPVSLTTGAAAAVEAEAAVGASENVKEEGVAATPAAPAAGGKKKKKGKK
ncbi:hypothetical protein TD95_000979 [Thielaviopsis punctulata]|uniref:SRP9 domain-containing protein n=1 Tax=Thielaviopsis punctulata TaxID=72032 RepID=A0A0F4ZD36_9PEZI|nr:hypothetical protein TD95_000979 [Thielaviopsis punctulata]